MENILSIIINIVFLVLSLIISGGILYRLIKSCFSKPQSKEVIIADKSEFYKSYIFKNQDSCSKKKYLIVFKCEDRQIDLYVSAQTYNSFQIGDKGTLKYNHSRFIDFNKN